MIARFFDLLTRFLRRLFAEKILDLRIILLWSLRSVFSLRSIGSFSSLETTKVGSSSSLFLSTMRGFEEGSTYETLYSHFIIFLLVRFRRWEVLIPNLFLTRGEMT